MTKISLTCKSYRVRHQAEHIVIEIEDAEPANIVPQLLAKPDVAQRLAISVRKVDALAAQGRLSVTRIDSCVRFREEDVLQFLDECNRAPVLTVIPPRT